MSPGMAVKEFQSGKVALKDERLVYRACSVAFARCFGLANPDQLVGKTDFDLLPAELAQEQLALDSQTILSAQTGISALEIAPVGAHHKPVQTMVVRTPILARDKQVRGIDLRLVDGVVPASTPAPITLNYQTLVNEGLQGSLIIGREALLFANDNAAIALGYHNARELMASAEVSGLFSRDQLGLVFASAVVDKTDATDYSRRRVCLLARSRVGTPVRLIARVTPLRWGAVQAALLSFVDIESALIPDEPASSGAKASNSSAVKTSVGHTPGSRSVQSTALPVRNLSVRESDELRQLRIDAQRYRHYVRAAADFYWELDARLTFRVISDGLSHVLGIPREYILGRTHQQLLDHPSNVNERDHWRDHLQQLQDQLPFRDFEFRWSSGGENRVLRFSGIPVFDRAQCFAGYRGVGCDVTASVRLAETTAYHANHDALTGLVNRRSFENTLHSSLESSRKNRQSHVLCFMDLDSFKIVNDTCGHQAGDELLRQLARVFDSLVRQSDVLARLGGDEFGVLLYQCDLAEALKLANQIRHEVENFEFLWEEKRFTVGVSIGLVVIDDRWDNIRSMFNAADSACYIAKNEGRNRVEVYRETELNPSNRQIANHWLEEINTALESSRLRLACQKVLPLDKQDQELRFEMLLRLEMPDGELISPAAFLPAAERYGLVSSLDIRVLELTLEWLAANPTIQQAVTQVSLNLSAGSFTDAACLEQLKNLISQSDVSAQKLCFEISETATIANLSMASDFMDQMSVHGCRFGIDEFGSGLSSFAWIRKLPVDYLKIDGLLVKDILDDPTDFTLVKSINEISKSMGRKTIAGCVESPDLLEAVQRIGINYGQGFHLGEPELIES